jgi:hypothetical protein
MPWHKGVPKGNIYEFNCAFRRNLSMTVSGRHTPLVVD